MIIRRRLIVGALLCMLLMAVAGALFIYKHSADTDQLSRFMKLHYGSFDQKKKVWQHNPDDEGDVDTQAYEVCAENF
ncbi:MAG: hypothetical protein QM749_20245 [Aquabacterium sp.]